MFLPVLLIACSSATSIVTIAEAPTSSATRVRVEGGELRLEMMSAYSPDSGPVFVVPLVPKAWKSTEPIPAWVSCLSYITKPNDCYVALRQAEYIEGPVKARSGRSENAWTTAVDGAEAAHSVRSAPGAPVVQSEWMPLISG